jgi:hypothetical protein
MINLPTLAVARDKVKRITENMQKMQKENEGAISKGFQIVEINGAAFGWGVANARWGGENAEITIAGLPVDLLVGATLHGVAFFGGFGKHADHMHNFANGTLAGAAYRSGVQMGLKSVEEKRHAAGAALPAPPGWALPPSGPQPAAPQAAPGMYAPPTPAR